jgi:hypothetical protein
MTKSPLSRIWHNMTGLSEKLAAGERLYLHCTAGAGTAAARVWIYHTGGGLSRKVFRR